MHWRGDAGDLCLRPAKKLLVRQVVREPLEFDLRRPVPGRGIA
ncbi:hypothetical protein [Mycolicibacterium vanbaalenii]|nr:hypothetical protein [Mycolicibacterium vanbaalenii]